MATARRIAPKATRKVARKATKKGGDRPLPIIVGFDTEYVVGRGDDVALPDGTPGNKLLCYSVFVLDLNTGRCGGGVIDVEGGSRRNRKNFATVLGQAIGTALDDGLLDEPPERVIAAAHFTRADLPGFRDFNKLKKRFKSVRRTYTTVIKPMVTGLRISPGREITVSIALCDTMLLAPAGAQSLAALGDLLGVSKVELPPGAIERMDLLRKADRKLFERYAIVDAEIAARWVQRMHIFFVADLNIGNRLPPTLGSAAVRLFKELISDAGRNVDQVLGMERIKGKGRSPVPTLADHYGFFADCYHGGRSEAFSVGFSIIAQIVDVDIAGAYTTALAHIRTPDWDRIRETKDLDEITNLTAMAVGRVKFAFPPGTTYPSLPVRCGTYGLIFPLAGTAYATGHEIRVALDQGATITVERGVIVPALDDFRPFAEFTKSVTAIRNRYPKGEAIERAAKEIGNSLYGKLAQSVETLRVRPDHGLNRQRGKRVFDSEIGEMTTLPPSPITQPLFAALATGLVRAVLSELLARLPQDAEVYTATTDGFLSTAGIDNVDVGGPVTQYFADLRQIVAGNRDVLEVKHKVAQVVTVKTRGTFSVRPLDPSNFSKPVLAKAGQRLMKPPTDPWAHSAAWAETYRTRTYDLVHTITQRIDLRTQWKHDADLIDRERSARVNLDFDFKRRLVDATTREGCLAATTAPWQTAEEFMAYRGDWDQFRKDNRRVLRTEADLADFERWRQTRDYYKAAGMRSDAYGTPAIAALLRGMRDGRFGLKVKAPDVLAFADDNGVHYTKGALDGGRKKGRKNVTLTQTLTTNEHGLITAALRRYPTLNLAGLAEVGSAAERGIFEAVKRVEVDKKSASLSTPPIWDSDAVDFTFSLEVGDRLQPIENEKENESASLSLRSADCHPKSSSMPIDAVLICSSERTGLSSTPASAAAAFRPKMNSQAATAEAEFSAASFRRKAAGRRLTERQVIDAFPEVSRVKLERETKRLAKAGRRSGATLRAGKAVGRGAVRVARRVGGNIGGGGKALGKNAVNIGKSVFNGTKKVGKAFAKGAKKVGCSVKKGAKKVGRGAKKVARKLKLW
jgi:hypothetical protein